MNADPVSSTVPATARTEVGVARRLVLQPETVPILFVMAAAIVAVIWNDRVGLRFGLSLWQALVLPGFFLLVAAVYTTWRPGPRLAEAMYYLALWELFTVFVERLSYLGCTLHYPLQDAAFAAADRTLGFDWLAWRHFVMARPWLVAFHKIFYDSFLVQPVIFPFVAAFLRPRRRNVEIFSAVIVAGLSTLVIGTLYPAIGPGEAWGIVSEQGPVIHALQSADPTAHPLPYAGIVSLPSFHTVMALLMIYAVRDIPFLFPVVVAINVAMLVTVPLGGNHYLVDMLAGAAVCGVSILIARAAMRRYFAPGEEVPPA